MLQRRRNHETFKVKMVAREERPDLLERFRIDKTPTLLIVDRKVVKRRLVEPRGCGEIQSFLAPWLK